MLVVVNVRGSSLWPQESAWGCPFPKPRRQLALRECGQGWGAWGGAPHWSGLLIGEAEGGWALPKGRLWRGGQVSPGLVCRGGQLWNFGEAQMETGTGCSRPRLSLMHPQ